MEKKKLKNIVKSDPEVNNKYGIILNKFMDSDKFKKLCKIANKKPHVEDKLFKIRF